MPSYSFKRAPSAVTSDYKVISDGDKYSFFRGTTTDFYNVSAACVVNYGVAQNIISSSGSWTGIPPAVYESQKSSILSILGTIPSQIFGKKVAYYLYGEGVPTYFAIFIDSESGIYFSETLNYNEKSLEFNILRNSNPAYVTALSIFLTTGGVFQNTFDAGAYEAIRAYALDAITSEGGDVAPIDVEIAI
jgi:hypothetical protein